MRSTKEATVGDRALKPKAHAPKSATLCTVKLCQHEQVRKTKRTGVSQGGGGRGVVRGAKGPPVGPLHNGEGPAADGLRHPRQELPCHSPPPGPTSCLKRRAPAPTIRRVICRGGVPEYRKVACPALHGPTPSRPHQHIHDPEAGVCRGSRGPRSGAPLGPAAPGRFLRASRPRVRQNPCGTPLPGGRGGHGAQNCRHKADGVARAQCSGGRGNIGFGEGGACGGLQGPCRPGQCCCLPFCTTAFARRLPWKVPCEVTVPRQHVSVA